MDALFYQQIQFILKAGNGIKTCLFDHDTREMLASLIPLSLFNENGYFNFDLISKKDRNSVEGMTCIVVLRPTNLNLLIEELACPHYSNYIVLFTSQIDPFVLEIMANSDIHCKVSEVHEINLDLFLVAPKLYLTAKVDASTSDNFYNSDDVKNNRREIDGIISALYSLEIMPKIYAFDQSNPSFQDNEENEFKNKLYNTDNISKEQICSDQENESCFTNEKKSSLIRLVQHGRSFALGKAVLSKINQNSFTKKGNLLLLDRSYDLITPLMYDWHYVSTINEHIGINSLKVELDGKTYQLNDTFFSKHLVDEISLIGNELKNLLSSFDSKTTSLGENGSDVPFLIRNIDQIQDIICTKSTVEKHLKIYHKVLSEAMKKTAFSEMQNEILKQKDFNLNKLAEFNDEEIFRLALLYTLKNIQSRSNNSTCIFDDKIIKFLEQLNSPIKSDTSTQIDNLKEENKIEFIERGTAIKNRITKFFSKYAYSSSGYRFAIDEDKDIKLSYVPPIRKIIKHAISSRLKESAFKVISNDYSNENLNRNLDKKEDCINDPLVIFIDGGITFAEYKEAIRAERIYNIEVILISTSVLDSKTYLE